MSERDPAGRWRKGKSGNPRGRPLARHRKLLDERADDLLGRMVDSALAGDLSALTWCCNRLLPPLKAVAMPVVLPLSGTLSDRGEAVLAAAAGGRIGTDEAGALLGALQTQGRIVESTELEERLRVLEGRINEQHPKPLGSR